MSEREERVALCREQIEASPYSHTVAAGWYVEDVPALEARLAEALEETPEETYEYIKSLEASLAEAERERDEWKAAAMRSRPGLLRAALPSESERSQR